MHINTDKDFAQLPAQLAAWRRRFPMFVADVDRIGLIINAHIQAYSRIMVMHRQTKSRSYLEKAAVEIAAINTVLETVNKLELMSLLSRR